MTMYDIHLHIHLHMVNSEGMSCQNLMVNLKTPPASVVWEADNPCLLCKHQISCTRAQVI